MKSTSTHAPIAPMMCRCACDSTQLRQTQDTSCPICKSVYFRSGIATLKLLLILPVTITLLIVVLEVGNLWLARVELENTLESAALAAVKEWGGGGGSSGTLTARQVGNEFAKANTANGISVDLAAIDPSLNWDSSNPPNQNANCTNGILVFGSITDTDPAVVFNASVAPGCGGAGSVFLDASAQGSLGVDNAWGVSFRTDPDPAINASLRVDRIVIDLDPNNTSGGANSFNFSSQSPTLSQNSPATIIASNGSQNDNFGFTQAPNAPVNQVNFSWDTTTDFPTVLEITFSGDTGTEVNAGEFVPGTGSNPTKFDAGFSPGDRFRFGADILVGGNQGAGHELGDIGALVTIYFSNAGVPEPNPSTGTFFNNQNQRLDRSQDCLDPATVVTDDRGFDHYVVHGRGILDLPCPLTSAATNNGQSYLVLTGGGAGGQAFAVRAQAEFQVPSLVQQLFGSLLGPYSVRAQSTAYFDCSEQDAFLIRVDEFLCN